MSELFHKIIHHLGGFAFLASVILLLVPLSGVLGGAMASYLATSRNTYVNSITAERSKWLEKLRSNFAEYAALLEKSCGLLTKGGVNNDVHRAATDNVKAEIHRVVALIRLQLNPRGDVDYNIITLMMHNTVFTPDTSRLVIEVSGYVIAHAQFLLKEEWEKVKWEAGGPLYRWKHRGDKLARTVEYTAFCEGEGSIGPIVESMKRADRELENLLTRARAAGASI